MSDPVNDAVRRVERPAWAFIDPPGAAEDVARRAAGEALRPIRELHTPAWLNCINDCCSGEQCKHRTRYCSSCEENWPCETAKLVYAESELAK